MQKMSKVRELQRATSAITLLGAASVLVFVTCAYTANAQCAYEISAIIEGPDCGIFGNAPLEPTAMNDNGVVVGTFFCGAGLEQPFMWSEEMGFVIIPLPPGGLSATPMDINNHNEIAGLMRQTGVSGERAFHWKDGVWTDLGLLPGSTQSRAFAINDAGEVVGESTNIFVGPVSAFIWRDGVMEPLKLPLGPNSIALDINSSATIAGWMGSGGAGFALGFLQNDGVTTDIPPLSPTEWNYVVAINNKGVAAGVSLIAVKSGSVPRRSWLFEDGILTDLGMLPTVNHRTIASDINDVNQVVGMASNPSPSTQAAFLWQSGETYDINTLIEPFDRTLGIGSADAINNQGIIVCHEDGLMYVLTPSNRPLGDVNIDCTVDEHDLIAVLEDWGPDKSGHPADIVTSATFAPPSDGTVDGADLAVVLGNWAPQPPPRPRGGSATTSAR